MPATVAEPLEITPDLIFRKNEKQLEAWRESLKHRFILYGGAAGGGKSFFLRWWCVFYLMLLFKWHGVRKAQVILASEDYPTLNDRQITRIQAEFPKSLGRLVLGESKEFRLADKYGGGRILLRNLDDPSKYLSSEFAGVAVEELTRNEEQTFHDLRLRMRWPGVARPVFVGATNPGGKGHGWVKKFWIDGKLPPEMLRKGLDKEFKWIPARVADNPFIAESYKDDLESLPDKMREAYSEGRWDLFVGQYFTNFLKERHVGLKRGSEIICPKTGTVYRIGFKQVGGQWLRDTGWQRWFSFDWGRAHNFAAYWHATAPDGKHITYREWVANDLTPRMLGEGIVERSLTDEGSAETIQQFFMSPDAFADRTGEATVAEQIRDVACRGNRFPAPVAASDDRVGGWELLYQLLDADEWLIAENCERLIDNLPTLIRDEKNVEDIKKVTGDDPADSARYGLYSRLGARKSSPEVRAAEAVLHIADPTMRAAKLDQFYAEEAKKNQPIPLVSRFGGKRRWRPGG